MREKNLCCLDFLVKLQLQLLQASGWHAPKRDCAAPAGEANISQGEARGNDEDEDEDEDEETKERKGEIERDMRRREEG
eukprot:167194-Hanusia_phi.AAC.1